MTFQDLGSAIIALSTGLCDVVKACLYATDERKKSVDFTRPYYSCRPGCFVTDRAAETKIGQGKRFKISLVTDGRRSKIILYQHLSILLVAGDKTIKILPL